MSGARKISELRDKLSPERRERIDAETARLVEEAKMRAADNDDPDDRGKAGDA